MRKILTNSILKYRSNIVSFFSIILRFFILIIFFYSFFIITFFFDDDVAVNLALVFFGHYEHVSVELVHYIICMFAFFFSSIGIIIYILYKLFKKTYLLFYSMKKKIKTKE